MSREKGGWSTCRAAVAAAGLKVRTSTELLVHMQPAGDPGLLSSERESRGCS